MDRVGLYAVFAGLLLGVAVTSGDALAPGAALAYLLLGTFAFGVFFALSALKASRRKLSETEQRSRS